jgi:hypothetical protein
MGRTSEKRYSKTCRYGCGKIIEWDAEKQVCVGPVSEEKHECNFMPKFHNARQLYEENKISDKLFDIIETYNKKYLTTQKIKVERIYL